MSITAKSIDESNMRVEKELWEAESKAYNDIFNYLKKKGLNEKELIKFSRLLIVYTKLIS